MKDLFLSKDTIDAYLKDLIERLYELDNPPRPDVWCPIGTSGREICYEMIKFLPNDLKSTIGIVDIHLNRGLNGGISFHVSDSGNQISDDEIDKILYNKTLLLIEGLVYSGGTLKYAYRAVQLHKPRTIISYSTITRFSSTVIPNYFSVLVDRHDRAWLHLKDDKKFPNKRLGGLGCVRMPSYKEDSSQALPIASTGESQFKTWQDIISFCKNANHICYVYEKDNVIQGYVVIKIIKEKSALMIKTLVVDKNYVGNYISGNLLRWLETYANANCLDQTRIWVASKDYTFYENLGYQFPEGNRPENLSGTIMVKKVPYLLPYGSAK